MDVAATVAETGVHCSAFKSPRRALIRSFLLSRDRWKEKALARKVEIKRLQNHVGSLQRGREVLKRRNQGLEVELVRSQAQVRELQERLAAESAQKKLS